MLSYTLDTAPLIPPCVKQGSNLVSVYIVLLHPIFVKYETKMTMVIIFKGIVSIILLKDGWKKITEKTIIIT
jgi:hypothetical protein